MIDTVCGEGLAELPGNISGLIITSQRDNVIEFQLLRTSHGRTTFPFHFDEEFSKLSRLSEELKCHDIPMLGLDLLATEPIRWHLIFLVEAIELAQLGVSMFNVAQRLMALDNFCDEEPFHTFLFILNPSNVCLIGQRARFQGNIPFLLLTQLDTNPQQNIVMLGRDNHAIRCCSFVVVGNLNSGTSQSQRKTLNSISSSFLP